MSDKNEIIMTQLLKIIKKVKNTGEGKRGGAPGEFTKGAQDIVEVGAKFTAAYATIYGFPLLVQALQDLTAAQLEDVYAAAAANPIIVNAGLIGAAVTIVFKAMTMGTGEDDRHLDGGKRRKSKKTRRTKKKRKSRKTRRTKNTRRTKRK